ncbi:MAG: ATP-binding protein [Clostridia bacterium]|nr:ATP-binding protein [Clostridia bacterium]
MEEFSLYVLDIVMNSVRAGAENIDVSLDDRGGLLTFKVTDDGCGMTEEQLERLSDPFFTTRKTRGVGLGVPFLKMLAEQTGGDVKVSSVAASESPESHGTTLVATFHSNHIDFIPMGDIKGTFVTLIQGNPDVNFTFVHETDGGEVRLSCAELKSVLGDGIPLSSPEVLAWIRGYLAEAYEEIK